MARISLTTAAIDRIKPPARGQLELFDKRLPSFGLRLSYHGSKAWFVMMRLDGKLIRVTLGRYPDISLSEAREEARKAMSLAAKGQDPRLVRMMAKQKRLEERRNTFAACAGEFLQKYAERRLRLSTQREYRRVLTGLDTEPWTDRPIAQITKRDILDVIEAIEERGSPGASKRTLVYLRKFFNWCAERDIITVVPTDRIKSPHPEVKRDRVLSDQELSYLLRALKEEENIFSPVIRVLLLTGQRRAEVAGMLWSELHGLESGKALWEIPGRRTKNKRSHLVPLAPSAVNLITSFVKIGDFVFTTTGITPVSGFGKVKARLDNRIGKFRSVDELKPMPAWTLHDLRRTMVTVMNEKLSVMPHIVEAIINHASGLAKAGVAGVYNRALYIDERRRALDSWAEYLAKLES